MRSWSGAAAVAMWGAFAVCGVAYSQDADCDNDGISDADAIAAGAADVNGNGVPDTCECITDLTGNGEVDGADLAVILSSWGEVSKPLPPADVNRDGLVNGFDLGVLLSSWGPCQTGPDFDLVFMSTQNLDPADSPPAFDEAHATILAGPLSITDTSALRVYTWSHSNSDPAHQYAYYAYRHADGDTSYVPSFWYLKNNEVPVFPFTGIDVGTLSLNGLTYRVWLLAGGNPFAIGEALAMGVQD